MEGIARFWAKIYGVKKYASIWHFWQCLEMHTLYCLLTDWMGGGGPCARDIKYLRVMHKSCHVRSLRKN